MRRGVAMRAVGRDGIDPAAQDGIAERIAELIIGESPLVRELREAILTIASLELPVIIQGPTGSGKELVAQALHLASGRTGPLVAFNVSSTSETMFEDALFGHVRGAFTSAVNTTAGYLLEAHRGTMFFDELNSLPLSAQPKLLRVLEARTFRPVGGSGDRTSDFRVVSATNEPVAELVAARRLRADLAERLSTFIIDVPPLGARPEDIPLLVAHFSRCSPVNRWKREIAFSGRALRLLQHRAWPGHVRELRNVVDRALAFAGPWATRVDTAMVQRALRQAALSLTPDARARRELEAVLEAAEWDTVRAAAALGVDRSTVYRRMRVLGIPAPRRAAGGRCGAVRERTPGAGARGRAGDASGERGLSAAPIGTNWQAIGTNKHQ